MASELLVFGAVEDGDDIVVSVYGGADNVCGTVTFTFPDPDDRTRIMALAWRWASTDEPVALGSGDGEVWLRRALER